jgi:hypothetical protein
LPPEPGPRKYIRARCETLQVARRGEDTGHRRRRRRLRLASWQSLCGLAPTVCFLSACAPRAPCTEVLLHSTVLPSSLAPGAGLFNVLVLGSVSALVTGAVTLSSRRVGAARELELAAACHVTDTLSLPACGRGSGACPCLALGRRPQTSPSWRAWTSLLTPYCPTRRSCVLPSLQQRRMRASFGGRGRRT